MLTYNEISFGNYTLTSETSRLDQEVYIELWSKGIIWDKSLGSVWLPLAEVRRSNEDSTGDWFDVIREEDKLLMNGTHDSLYSLLIDARFELPSGM